MDENSFNRLVKVKVVGSLKGVIGAIPKETILTMPLKEAIEYQNFGVIEYLDTDLIKYNKPQNKTER